MERGSRQDTSWMQFGACRKYPPDLFIPKQSGAGVGRAKRICNTECDPEVKKRCLEYALTNKPVGIWGGTTERERRRMLKEQKLKAVEAARLALGNLQVQPPATS